MATLGGLPLDGRPLMDRPGPPGKTWTRCKGIFGQKGVRPMADQGMVKKRGSGQAADGRPRRGRGRPGWRTLCLWALVAVSVLLGSWDVSAQESVVRVGSSITVAPGERVIGQLTAVGGAIEILGSVEGDVIAIGGLISVDGRVQGDVVALGGNVRLGPNARVSGDVSVVGGTLTRDPQAVVEGEISSVSFSEGFRFRFDFDDLRRVGWHGLDFPWVLLYVGGLFALALMVATVIPHHVDAVARAMESNAGRCIVIGLVAVLLMVPLTLLLILTIVGPPLLWLGFFAAKILGYVALVSLVGRRVAERMAGPTSPVWQVLLGVVLVALVRYIPVLGPLFSLTVTLWSLGAVLDTKFGTNRPWLPPRQAAG